MIVRNYPMYYLTYRTVIVMLQFSQDMPHHKYNAKPMESVQKYILGRYKFNTGMIARGRQLSTGHAAKKKMNVNKFEAVNY